MRRRDFLRAVGAMLLAAPAVPLLVDRVKRPSFAVPAGIQRLYEYTSWSTARYPVPKWSPRILTLVAANGNYRVEPSSPVLLTSAPCPRGKRWLFQGFKIDQYRLDGGGPPLGRAKWPTLSGGDVFDRSGTPVRREWASVSELREGEYLQAKLTVHAPGMVACVIAHVAEYPEDGEEAA